MSWWQTLPSQINPVALTIGTLEIRWYGIMYLLAFITVYLLVQFRIRTENRFDDITNSNIIDILSAAIIGVIIGGRLGYALFYNPSYFFANPAQIIFPTSSGEFTGISGLSFHGGVIGVIIATAIIIKKRGLCFKKLSDLFIPTIPLGYIWGRVGNFLNGELWGQPTNSPIGLYFPLAPDNGTLLRHPSQLYEAALEGLLIFAILWPLRKHSKLKHKMLPVYLIAYSIARFTVEFWREPDAHIGTIALGLSLGQILSIATALGALIFLALNRRQKIS